jgi:hypothetical protein
MAVNTTNYKFNKPVVGADSDSWGGELNENWDKIDSLLYGASYTDGDSQTVERIQPDLLQGSWAVNGTAITATAAELNNIPAAITGAASTVLSSNLSSGKVLISDENGKISASSGVSSTELDKLDGLTASTAQLNHVDGVTSAIQTQLDAKAPLLNPVFSGTATIPAINVTTTQVTTANITLANITTLDIGVWQVVSNGTTLQFKIGSNVYMTLDNSGNLNVAGNVNSNATL